MKRIIEIDDEVYKNIINAHKNIAPDIVRAYDSTFVDALNDSTSLDDMLDKIIADIKQRPYGIAHDLVVQGIKYERADILEVIEGYKESEDEQMKMVIELPNSLYANLHKITNGTGASKRILDCAKKGVPIPKGHEILVDANVYLNSKEADFSKDTICNHQL